MKKRALFIFVTTLCALAAAVVIGQSDNQLSPKQERREVREKRRAERQAQFEKSIDSMVLAKTFQFNPQTMTQMPAGAMKIISNPNFNVGYWDGTVDIFLPYMKGYTPPYHSVILNYTLPSVSNYITEQTDDGWRVSFSSSLFSSSEYSFILEVSSRYGGATLTVKSTWYNPMQYTGTISKLY